MGTKHTHFHLDIYGIMDEVTSILVFQCRKCRYIIGDSSHGMTASRNKKLQTISLQRVRNVKVAESIDVLRDEGNLSLFYAIKCPNCDSHIGRKYMATSPEMDSVRGLFTLDIDAHQSSQIGKAKMHATSEAGAVPPSPDSIMNVMIVGTESSLTEIVERTSRLAQVQSLVLTLDQRIQKLEQNMQS